MANFSQISSGGYALTNLDVGPFADNMQFLNTDESGIIETTEYYHIAKTFRDNSDSTDTQELSAVESYEDSETGTRILDEEVNMKNGSLNVKSLSFGDKAIMKYDTDEHAMRISFKKDYDFTFKDYETYSEDISDLIWNVREMDKNGNILSDIIDGTIIDIIRDSYHNIVYINFIKSFSVETSNNDYSEYYNIINNKEYLLKSITGDMNSRYGLYMFSPNLSLILDNAEKIVIYIPNSIENIGCATFSNHNEKWYFVFEENSKLKVIGDEGFAASGNNNAYTENLIILPDTITDIFTDALYGCNVQYTGPLLNVAEENGYWGAYKFNGVLTGNF